MREFRQVSLPQRRLFDFQVETAAADGLADVLTAVTKAGLTDKRGQSLAGQLKETRQGKNPVVVVSAAQDQPAFVSALVAHFGTQSALGAVLAAKACGAAEIILYGDARADTLAAEIEKHGVKLTRISGGYTPVLRAPSALLAALDGRPVRSGLMDALIVQEGYQGRPTLPLDVETAIWLYACCTPACAGQSDMGKFMLLEEKENETLLQLPLGGTLAELTEALALPTSHPFLIGGLTGFFADALAEHKIAYQSRYDSMKLYDTCMVQAGRELCAQAYAHSCGKCVLCREGSWQYMAMFADISEGRGKKTDLALALDMGELIRAGAFCDFGRQMVDIPMTLAALSKTEINAHITRKQCPAGACEAFMDFVIDPKICTGCCDCLDVCEEDAIQGKSGFIHMIDPVMCTKCGKCRVVCAAGAVIASTGRVKLPKKPTRVGRFR